MCVIVYSPINGKMPANDVLDKCYAINPDCMGFMYVDENDEIQIHKFNDLESCKPALKKAYEKYSSTSPIVLHMRQATAGKISLATAHPFKISDEFAFAHNGTITHYPVTKDSELSDTMMFNKIVLQRLPVGWETHDKIKGLIADYVGQSRLLFLKRDRTVTIINGENQGAFWHTDGNWYSKSAWKNVKLTKDEVKNPLSTYLSSAEYWSNTSYHRHKNLVKECYSCRFWDVTRPFTEGGMTFQLCENCYNEIKEMIEKRYGEDNDKKLLMQ